MFFRHPAWGFVNPRPPTVTSPSSLLDTDVSNWIGYVIADGGSVSPTQQDRVNNLVLDLKAGTLWNKCDSFWLHAGEGDASQAKISPKYLTFMTFPIATPSVSWRGYESNGNILDTTLVPATVPMNFTSGGGSLGFFVGQVDAFTYASNSINVGAVNTASTAYTQMAVDPYYSAVATFYMNDATPHSATIADNDSYTGKYGFWLLVRTAATGSNNVALYRDGTLMGLFSSDSIAAPDNSIAFMGRNDGGSTYTATETDPYSLSWVGGPLNSTEAASLSTLFLDYLASYNIRPVRNGLKASQEFTSTPWSLSSANLVLTPHAIVAPDGTTGVHKLSVATTTSYEQLGSPVTWSSATNTFSCYVKPSGWRFLQMRLYGDDDTVAWFDLQWNTPGSITTTAGTHGMVEDPVGSGWWRCWVQAGSAVLCRITPVDNNSSWDSTTAGTDGIDIWGAQLNGGSTMLPYNRQKP